MTLFKKGDVVVVFDPLHPNNIQTSEVVAVSRTEYNPKMRLKGDLKFDWWTDGTPLNRFDKRRLLSPEDVVAAQAAEENRSKRNALSSKILTLVDTAARDIRNKLQRETPNFSAVRVIVDELKANLEIMSQRAEALELPDASSTETSDYILRIANSQQI